MKAVQNKIKVAILGTRGIPNRYGGFEQCAEKIAFYLGKKGHQITVYNPPSHPYNIKSWNGIKIEKILFKEWRFTYVNLFLYDYISLKHALSQDFDIILELGYSPCSLFYFLKKNKQAKIVTNMDGLEWKRGKWNIWARKTLQFSETLAVRKSDALVTDNPGIRDYLMNKYKKDSHYIPYGAEFINPPGEEGLKEYQLEKYKYFLMIARLEPENNIEIVLDGYLTSGSEEPFIIVGPETTKYSNLLKKKYQKFPNIKFFGGIYDFQKLTLLRQYTRIYFHGHSVGGTNPSLLEAMASNAFIVAHHNIFNKNVLGANGIYFSDKKKVTDIIHTYCEEERDKFIINNRKKIKKEFSWEKVAEKYLRLFRKLA